jgi:hypothetical protein
MSTASREYLSGFKLGNYQACIQLRDAVVAAIQALNEHGEVANFYARVVNGSDELVDEDVDVQQVNAVTGEQFPLLWLNLTYDPDQLSEKQLEELEQQYQLTLTATARSLVDLL